MLQNFNSYLSSEDIENITEGIRRAVKEMGDEDMIPAPFSLTSIPRIAVFKPQTLAPLLTVRKSVTLFPSLLASSDADKVSIQFFCLCMYIVQSMNSSSL